MRGMRAMVAGLAAVALIAPGASAGADETPATTVTTTVTQAADGLTVSGDVAFAPYTMQVAEDFSGDANSVVPGELGTDITGAFITSDPAKPNDLLFTMQMDSLPGGGLPEAVIYNWDLLVNGAAAGGGTSSNLVWKRTNVTGLTASTAPYIRLQTCAPGGTGNTCTAGSQLPGGMDMDTAALTATLRLRDLGATPGALIGGNGLSVYHGTGMLWFPGVTSDTAFIDEEFAVPRRDGAVKVAVVPAGAPTPKTFSHSATPSGAGANGAFSVKIPTENFAAGAYDVVTQACWGGNCSVTHTPVNL